MVWYGMVWHGMVWYGMMWFGMVWYVMVWNEMISDDLVDSLISTIIRCVTVQGDISNAMVWYGADRYE